MTVIARKPAYLSMNPGSGAEAIAKGMRSKLLGALSGAKPAQFGITVAGLAGNLTAIPAYEDILTLAKGDKEMVNAYMGEMLSGATRNSPGRGGGTTTTTTGDPFRTPERGITKYNVGAFPRRHSAIGKSSNQVRQDQKRGKSSTVLQRGSVKLRYRPAVAYDTYYKKFRKFRRIGQYAY